MVTEPEELNCLNGKNSAELEQEQVSSHYSTNILAAIYKLK